MDKGLTVPKWVLITGELINQACIGTLYMALNSISNKLVVSLQPLTCYYFKFHLNSWKILLIGHKINLCSYNKQMSYTLDHSEK